MHLREGEVVEKTVKRHLTPYVFKLARVIALAIPVYILLFYAASEIDGEWIFYAFAAVSFFIGIIIALVSIDYLLDKLIITNKRVIWINWKSLINKEEHETELLDIVDIDTREKGILSKLRMFDYGTLEVETAASKTCIHFRDCPGPERINHFINQQMAKRKISVFGKKDNETITAQRTPHKNAEPEEWSVN